MLNKKKEPDEKRKDAQNLLETMIAEFPNFSIPKAAVAIKVYPKLVYTILYDNLHLKPYKFHELHKLMEKGKILPNMHLSLPSVAKFHFIC